MLSFFLWGKVNSYPRGFRIGVLELRSGDNTKAFEACLYFSGICIWSMEIKCLFLLSKSHTINFWWLLCLVTRPWLSNSVAQIPLQAYKLWWKWMIKWGQGLDWLHLLCFSPSPQSQQFLNIPHLPGVYEIRDILHNFQGKALFFLSVLYFILRVKGQTKCILNIQQELLTWAKHKIYRKIIKTITYLFMEERKIN